MTVAINNNSRPESDFDKVIKGLTVARDVFGIPVAVEQFQHLMNQNKQFSQQQEELASQKDPNSAQSKQARAEQSAVYNFLKNQGYMNSSDYNAAINNLNGSPNGPLKEGEVRQQPSNAFDLAKNPEMSPLVNLAKAQISANAMGNKFNSINDTKKEMQQNSIHEQVLGKIDKDPTLAKQLVQYQNLGNALSLLSKSDHITPQQFDEAQQSIRGNLGIKGSSGVDERSHTYLNSIGLNADRWSQILSGAPSNMNPNDPFLKHIKQLAGIELDNIQAQTKRRINTLTQGNGWLYNQRPDLYQGLQDKISSVAGQYSSSNPEPSQKLAGGQSPSSDIGIGTNATAAPSYDPDVMSFAKTHGISNDQALAIKKQRLGQ